MEIQLWKEILSPYEQAVDELLVKFNHIIMQYKSMGKYSPIESVTGRVKTVSSIIDKLQKKNIPMDRIGFEPECPYLAPEPNRGKRNSSLNIPYVIAAMAQIKGITEEEVRKAAWDNSLKLYHMEK